MTARVKNKEDAILDQIQEKLSSLFPGVEFNIGWNWLNIRGRVSRMGYFVEVDQASLREKYGVPMLTIGSIVLDLGTGNEYLNLDYRNEPELVFANKPSRKTYLSLKEKKSDKEIETVIRELSGLNLIGNQNHWARAAEILKKFRDSQRKQ